MPRTEDKGRSLVESVLDLAYAPKCALCGFLGTDPICTVCAGSFDAYDTELSERGALEHLDAVARLYRYEGRAEQAVKRLKYSRVTSLARPMAARLADFAAQLNLLDLDLFLPVPIHPARRRLRGFNQSELLCEFLPGSAVRFDILHRIRATAPQAGLTLEQRGENIRDAFRADPAAAGAHVVLIDDVLTSGFTALECAKALKAVGAKEVTALAFAGG